jgi:hypothetical protein
MEHFDWSYVQNMTSKSFTCGYCGSSVSSEKGWFVHLQPSGVFAGEIYICHQCGKPTYFDRLTEEQTPGHIFGNQISGVNDEMIEKLYEEARKCTSCGSYTAAVLCCRKILMHIAILKGASEGLKFIEYVEYLSNQNYVPPDAKEWVDQIREKGNEANHEIIIMDRETAEYLMGFVEMLLKIIFEFPSIVKKRTSVTLP